MTAKTVKALLITFRPHQWVKNLFVIAPLVFSQHLFDLAYALPSIAAMATFCSLSGAIYTFNDLRDLEEDRRHPNKRNRPIARGEVPVSTAKTAAIILATGAILASLAIHVRFAMFAVAYAAANIAYSVYFKKIAFVDVGFIAGGFLLRVAAGAAAISVPVSGWLFACTALLSAMLGFGKRIHELLMLERQSVAPNATRLALRGYQATTLRVVLWGLGIATCLSYALYTLDTRTVDAFRTTKLVWTLPFCLFGIYRFLQLAMWQPQDRSPTDQILRDWPFLTNLILWGATVLAIVYRTSF